MCTDFIPLWKVSNFIRTRLPEWSFMKFIECINFMNDCRRVYGLYSMVESFGFHSYALARMKFYKIYRVYKFLKWLPQSVRTLFHGGKLQSSFVRSCPNEFYEIYRVYKFHNQMPQSVRALFHHIKCGKVSEFIRTLLPEWVFMKCDVINAHIS